MKCDVNCKFYTMCWNVGEGICEVGEDCDRYESERPHGEWIYKDMKGQFCSVCDKQSVWKFNFCPNCGASMEKKENER